MNRISVIMGAYNAEKTLNRCIDSILKQTYQDWVFIICDDGSFDNTSCILSQYKEKYPDKFILLSNNKNKGLAYTLNHCLSYVQSEYIARMDADDISLPSRFYSQIEFLDQHKEYSFVGCAVERFDENGVWEKSFIKNSDPDISMFYYSSVFVHPTVMIRKNVLKNVNGYKDIWYTKRCEDYDLWMRLYAKSFKGYILKEILFQYYDGEDSLVKKKYRYRICEAVMRAKNYASLGMYPKGIIYIFKPLIAGLLPKKFIRKLSTAISWRIR